MAQVINTNSLSLLTQNNLNKSQSSLNTAIERLSSGMRINSAKDDAAGQAIANRFTANIKGLTQASRNANDGISIAQTTEGALTEVNNNLQRVRELAVQASTGTNSPTDLKSIQDEISQRLDEINRVSEQTQFNGVKVLSAQAGKLSIQVGANDGETIDIDLKEISAKTLGLESFNVNGKGEVANTAATSKDLLAAEFTKAGTANANGSFDYSKAVTTANAKASSADVFKNLADGATVTYAGTDNGLGKAATTNTYTYDKATDSFSFAVADAANADVAAYLTPAAGGVTAAKVTIGGSSQNVIVDNTGKITAADDGAVLYLDASGNLSKTNGGTDAQATMTTLAAAMSTATTGTGGTIEVGGTVLTADATTGGVFDVTATISASKLQGLANAGGYATATHTVAAGSATAGGAVTVTAGGAAAYIDVDGALTAATETTVTTTYTVQTNGKVTDAFAAQVYTTAAGELTFDEKTLSEATANPLKAIDAALSKVDELRSSLGAVQNRFDSVIANLGTTITNLSSSRSRIEDADYAVEVSNMTRAQILQQAGTSVLAQANQTTQNVLSLLR